MNWLSVDPPENLQPLSYPYLGWSISSSQTASKKGNKNRKNSTSQQGPQWGGPCAGPGGIRNPKTPPLVLWSPTSPLGAAGPTMAILCTQCFKWYEESLIRLWYKVQISLRHVFLSSWKRCILMVLTSNIIKYYQFPVTKLQEIICLLKQEINKNNQPGSGASAERVQVKKQVLK